MPVIASQYHAPWWLQNPHLATILPSMYRRTGKPDYERERYSMPDGDFVDLDWLRSGNRRVIVLSHGLEGNSWRGYMAGTALYHARHGYDVLAWNCRSCSGEPNMLPRFYHHADIADLAELIGMLAGRYDSIYLAGFSMGGNISLNYLGKYPSVPSQVRGAAVFSVPVDLRNSVDELMRPGNSFYMKRFLRKLRVKMKLKAERFPDVIDTDGLDEIRDFIEFDERYTAPLHGFSSASDFYEKGSVSDSLGKIRIPVLIVNALNDPFLGPRCYPDEICAGLEKIFLEMPQGGGHVGFATDRYFNSYMDFRPMEFFEEFCR